MKRLKLSTIVSKELYVARAADTQLKNLIVDMGRPGYILVARQMGKTNLLLNARREFEDKNHIFVYVDLSNHFSTSRACFRNIIDTAIETHSEELGHLQSTVTEKRKLTNLPPHKEHELELRLLLKNIPGKLIVLLDEIDTLTMSDYSDEVFAQIRSTYFSRINFPEYNRLSYILSGVAEPSEIIKDKNISPFNIGEKIYLDDFTYDEFLAFIDKAKLKFDCEICERIFYWANGNPRITWDICSEIENILTHENTPTMADVDSVVTKLYLTDFDKAPVDHIRNLVAADRELKNAVIQIKYNKGSTLDDELKRKLYLSGITKAQFKADDIKIKNRVVEASLSDQWITNLEKKEKDLFELAEDKYKCSEFQEAANLYEKFLQRTDISEKEKVFAHYHAGLSYYKLKQYQIALSHLTLGLCDKESFAEIYLNQMLDISLCHYYLRDYESSIESLKLVLEETKDDERWCRAALNLAGAYYNLNFDLFKSEIFKLNNLVLKKVDACKFSQDLLMHFKGTAFHNIGQAYRQSKDAENAKLFFQNAATVCSPNMKLKPLYEYLALEESLDKKKELLAEIEDIILKNHLHVDGSSEGELALDLSTINRILIVAFGLDKYAFGRLLDYSVTSIYNNSKSKNQIQYELAYSALFLKNVPIGKGLLNIILSTDNVDAAEPEVYFNCYKFLFAFADSDHEFEIYSKYFELFENSQSLRKIDVFDISNFEFAVVQSINRRNYTKAQNLINVIKSRYDSVDESLKLHYIKIFYYEMRLHQLIGDWANEQRLSRQIIKFIDESDIRNQHILNQNELSSILKQARDSVSKTFEIVKGKDSYKRNQRVRVKYLDGTILEAKFKKIENDLVLGKCHLLK